MNIKKFNQYLKESNSFDDILLSKSSEEYRWIDDEYGVVICDDKTLLNICRDAIDDFKDNIDLFSSIKIAFVDSVNDGDLLARFRSGTATNEPVLMLCERNMREGAEEYDLSLRTVVETTVFHELGHAICELERGVFGYEYLEYGDEEEWVEEFANGFYEFRDIPHDLEAFIKAFHEQKTGY